MSKSRGYGPVPAFMTQKTQRMRNQRIVNDYKRRSNDNRQQAGGVMTYCTLIALHDLYGIGPKRLADFCGAAGKIQAEYAADLEKLGQDEALRILNAKAGGAADDYVLPTLAKHASNGYKLKEIRDIMLVNDQRFAGRYALTSCLAALRTRWGYGEKRLHDVRAEADKNYRQFLRWAVEGRGDDDAKNDGTGQAYAYEKLAAVVRQIMHDDNIKVEYAAGAKPVFVESF